VKNKVHNNQQDSLWRKQRLHLPYNIIYLLFMLFTDIIAHGKSAVGEGNKIQEAVTRDTTQEQGTSSCIAAVVFDSVDGWQLLFLFLLVFEKSSDGARSDEQ
jgi:hypothetical protein